MLISCTGPISPSSTSRTVKIVTCGCTVRNNSCSSIGSCSPQSRAVRINCAPRANCYWHPVPQTHPRTPRHSNSTVSDTCQTVTSTDTLPQANQQMKLFLDTYRIARATQVEELVDEVTLTASSEVRNNSSPDQSYSVLIDEDHGTHNTWIFPTIQMGPLTIDHDLKVTAHVIQCAPPQARLFLTSPYFNFTDKYTQLMLESRADIQIIVASPEVRTMTLVNTSLTCGRRMDSGRAQACRATSRTRTAKCCKTFSTASTATISSTALNCSSTRARSGPFTPRGSGSVCLRTRRLTICPR